MLLLLVFGLLFGFFAFGTEISPSKSVAWGPGLDPDPSYILPVWYYFVQLKDAAGNNITKSPGPEEIFCRVEGVSAEEECTIFPQQLDRWDGSFVCRYKVLSPCSGLRIEIVTKNDEHIANSPYLIKTSSLGSSGWLCPDSSNCPIPSENWKSELHCPGPSVHLLKDLSVWAPKSVNFSRVLEEAKERWGSSPGAYSFCHYRIVSNRIFRKCYGEHVGFNMFSDNILLSLARKVELPNTEFLMNLGDWPLESHKEEPVPVLSWCGSDNSIDIILPTYELAESSLEMMGRQSIDVHSVAEMSKTPWAEKIRKGFFRGRDSRRERLKLVKMARDNPNYLEAGITHFFFFREEIDEYGPETIQIPMGDFFKFAYQVSVDGTVAAYRFPFLLAGDSLVMKQDSRFFEYFYRDLEPYVHYLPIKQDLSDLLTQIDWARKNNDKVLEMVANARRFVDERLQPTNVLCEYVTVLEEYTKILKEQPIEAAEDMEEVSQTPPSSNCTCSSATSPTEPSKEEL